MPATPTEIADVLARASPRYRAAHDALGRAVRKAFPRATAGVLFGVPGWGIQRPAGAPTLPRAGTMPSDRIVVGLAERKAGLTVYVWYPAPGGLQVHKAALTKAGFKVMVGCAAWNRQGEMPIAPLAAVLEDMAARDRGA